MISLGSNSMTGPGLQNPWSCRFSHLIWTCERVERDTRLTESFFKRKWAATNWTYAILIYSASKVWSGRLTCDYEGRPIRLRRWWWRRRRRWRRRRQWCWWSTKSTKFFAGWRCPCGAGHPLPLRTIGAIKTPFTGGGRPSTGNSDKLLIWLLPRLSISFSFFLALSLSSRFLEPTCPSGSRSNASDTLFGWDGGGGGGGGSRTTGSRLHSPLPGDHWPAGGTMLTTNDFVDRRVLRGNWPRQHRRVNDGRVAATGWSVH